MKSAADEGPPTMRTKSAELFPAAAAEDNSPAATEPSATTDELAGIAATVTTVAEPTCRTTRPVSFDAGAAVEVFPEAEPATTFTGSPRVMLIARIVAFVPLSNINVGPAIELAVEPST